MNLYRFWFGGKLWWGCYANTDSEARSFAYGLVPDGYTLECITPEESLIRSLMNTEK